MRRNGFTLIELLLSIATIGVLVLIVASLVTALGQSRARTETALTVQDEGERVLAMIEDGVRNASGISAPLFGTTGAALMLHRDDPMKEPTTFGADSARIIIREGQDSVAPLTSSRVIASDFSVAHNGQSDTHGTVRITFTLSAVNPSKRPEFDYARTFTTSVSLRR